MAIRPDTELAPNVIAATGSYPLGSSKNETAPGVNDGTPYNLTRANDVFGMQQALLKIANIIASGNADTALDKNSSQYMQALLHMVLSASIFTDSGAADAYVLDVVGNNPAPADYEANMSFEFIVGNTNTGASTADVESLGAKSIRLNGVVLSGGELVVGERVTIVFDFANNWFELVRDEGRVVQQVNTQDGAVATGTTTTPYDDSIPQNTEGDEYMTRVITPKSTTNRLIIDVTIVLSSSGANPDMVVGLFQDSVAGALAAVAETIVTGEVNTISFRHEMAAGVVVPTTFKVRAGASLAGTTTFNGEASARKLGGVMASSITVTEVRP